MALVLAGAAALICAVKTFTPERLTPIVCKIANDMTDADVQLSKIRIFFKPAFPVIAVEMDSLTVISHAFRSLPAEERAELPAFADTLLTLEHFAGSLNLKPLLTRGEIALKDVELVRPGVNIVLDRNGIGNFNITKSEPDSTSTSTTTIPSLSIEHFAFVEPREIRYFNASDNTSAAVLLLNTAFVDGAEQPRYHIKVNGRLDGPMARTLLNLDDIEFGMDGRVNWAPANPRLLSLEEFNIQGAFFRAMLNTRISLDSVLTIEQADFSTAPVAVSEALAVVPDSLLEAYRLKAPYFNTDAAISINGKLNRPFTPGRDTIPYASAGIEMPACLLKYGPARLHNLSLSAKIELEGNNLDSAQAVIEKFTVAGPATSLDINANISNAISDPQFTTALKGKVQLKDLPPIVADMAQGYISGRLDIDIEANGAAHMFTASHFHELDVHGTMTGNKLFYLSNDTAKMMDINAAQFNFGSRQQTESPTGEKALVATLKIDTANILVDGVDISVGKFGIGAGVLNQKRSADTTLVVPMGGGISIGSLKVISITDSAGMSSRNIAGNLQLKRYRESKHTPEILADLQLQRLSAGTKTSRFLLRKAELHASVHKLPSSKRRAAIKHTADSIRQVHPSLSPDSVMRLAIEKRRRNHVPGQHRVHGEMTADDNEIIEWGVSKGLQRFLLEWQFNGTLATNAARIYTPLFPLTNRISRLDMTFSNDTVRLNNISYRAGRSDMRMSGRISNIRRGLLAKTGDNSLKINMELMSDTVDVNQLAAAAFAGAAYAERLRKGTARGIAGMSDDETLDDELESLISEEPDSVGPLLVPTNIDARINVNSHNVLYSDLLLNTLSGEILVYGGGVNLHNLKAVSDAGDISLSALYSAPRATDMQFGFSLDMERINVERFLNLVPAIDSIMPLMRDFSGIINADIAATVDIDSTMNMVLPSLDAAVRLTGDSLTLINADTYNTLGKWLRFKDRADNRINHLNVELLVKDNMMQLFPFTFNIDRYKLGIVGSNDLALNFNYHIAVLKSPLPFKFGINISGTPEKYKVRFGGAKFKEGEAIEQVNVVDTARVNLIKQIENVFRRGVHNSRFAKLQVGAVPTAAEFEKDDRPLSRADSVALVREGLIPASELPAEETPETNVNPENKEAVKNEQ